MGSWQLHKRTETGLLTMRLQLNGYCGSTTNQKDLEPNHFLASTKHKLKTACRRILSFTVTDSGWNYPFTKFSWLIRHLSKMWRIWVQILWCSAILSMEVTATKTGNSQDWLKRGPGGDPCFFLVIVSSITTIDEPTERSKTSVLNGQYGLTAKAYLLAPKKRKPFRWLCINETISFFWKTIWARWCTLIPNSLGRSRNQKGRKGTCKEKCLWRRLYKGADGNYYWVSKPP